MSKIDPKNFQPDNRSAAEIADKILDDIGSDLLSLNQRLADTNTMKELNEYLGHYTDNDILLKSMKLYQAIALESSKYKNSQMFAPRQPRKFISEQGLFVISVLRKELEKEAQEALDDTRNPDGSNKMFISKLIHQANNIEQSAEEAEDSVKSFASEEYYLFKENIQLLDNAEKDLRSLAKKLSIPLIEPDGQQRGGGRGGQ